MDLPSPLIDAPVHGTMLAFQAFARLSIVYKANVEHPQDSLTFIDHATGAVVDVPTLLEAGASASAIRYFRYVRRRPSGSLATEDTSALSTLMRHVAAHTIDDPANRPLKLVPENVLWGQFGGQEELAIGGQPIRICHLAVAASVVVLSGLGDPTSVRIVVSFSITDEAERRGLARIEGCDVSDKSTSASRACCAFLTMTAGSEAQTFVCISDVRAHDAVSVR